MKKNFIYFVFAGLFTMGMITACDKENPVDNGGGTEKPGDGGDNNGEDGGDNDTSFPIEEMLAGDYKTKVSVDFADKVTETENKIIISKSADDAIKVEIKNFSFGSINIGDLAIGSCKLAKTETENVFSFTGKETLDVVIVPNTQAVPCDVTIKEGSIGNNNLSMNIDVVTMEGAINLKVACTGSKMSGQESAEAKILEFSFDKENPKNAVILEQPKWVEKDEAYIFSVDMNYIKSNPEALKHLVPTIKVSDKASCNVKNGEEQDFSNDVNIIVTAENLNTASFTVKAPAKIYTEMKYSYDEWDILKPQNEDVKQEWLSPKPTEELATANEGVAYLKHLGILPMYPPYKGEYATLKEEKGYKNAAAKLVTLDTKGAGLGMAPAITPGSLFTGKFEFQAEMDPNKQLKLTKFGLPYAKKPLSFKGYYKYKSGDKYIDGNQKPAVEIPGKKDQCSIQAVLYTEELDEKGNNIPLDGTNINGTETNDRRVAVAQLEDGTDKADWTEFNIPFKYLNGKTYEAGKKYYLAIVCSSSKDGDKFQGAINSTLLIDEFEIIGE